MSYFYYEPNVSAGAVPPGNSTRPSAPFANGARVPPGNLGGATMDASNVSAGSVPPKAMKARGSKQPIDMKSAEAEAEAIRQQVAKSRAAKKGKLSGGGKSGRTVKGNGPLGSIYRGPVASGSAASSGISIRGGKSFPDPVYRGPQTAKQRTQPLAGGIPCSHGAGCMCGHGCGMCGSMPVESKAVSLYNPNAAKAAMGGHGVGCTCGVCSVKMARKQSRNRRNMRGGRCGQPMRGREQASVVDKLSQLEQMMNALAGHMRSGEQVSPDKWAAMRSAAAEVPREAFARQFASMKGGASEHVAIRGDFQAVGWPWNVIAPKFANANLYGDYKFDDWSFNGVKLLDVLTAQGFPRGSTMAITMLNCIYSCLGRGIITDGDIDMDRPMFLQFCFALGRTYHDIPYHNEGHGAAMLQGVAMILKFYEGRQNVHNPRMVNFTNAEKLYMLCAAGGHDAGHKGVDNKMVWCLLPRLKYRTLGNVWENTAPIEKYHAYLTLKVMRNYPFTNVAVEGDGGWQQWITECIMGTYDSEKSKLKDNDVLGDGTNWSWDELDTYNEGHEEWELKRLVARCIFGMSDVKGWALAMLEPVYYEAPKILYELVIQGDIVTWIGNNEDFTNFETEYEGEGGPGYDFTDDLGWDADPELDYYPGAWMREQPLLLGWNVPRAVLGWANGLDRSGAQTQVNFINYVVGPMANNYFFPMMEDMKVAAELVDPTDKLTQLNAVLSPDEQVPPLTQKKAFWTACRYVGIHPLPQIHVGVDRPVLTSIVLAQQGTNASATNQ